MKQISLAILIAFFSALSVNTMYADNKNCSYPASPSHDQSCKGQMATEYVNGNGFVTIAIPITISETIIAVTGPYPNPSWYISNGQIIVSLNLNEADFSNNVAWMEVIVNGGYYHVKLIKS